MTLTTLSKGVLTTFGALALVTWASTASAAGPAKSVMILEKCPVEEGKIDGDIENSLNDMVVGYNSHTTTAFDKHADKDVSITRIEGPGKSTHKNNKADYLQHLKDSWAKLKNPTWEHVVPCKNPVMVRGMWKVIVNYDYKWTPPEKEERPDKAVAVMYFKQNGDLVDATFVITK